MAADTVAGETGPAEFGILGPLEVCRTGRAVPLGGPRQRAVLALLLLEANRVVSMDRLAEDLWDGDPPAGWVTTLQTYVFHLRRALEPDRSPGSAGDILVTRGRGYLLRVDREHLDAALFQDGFTAGRAALEAGRYAQAAETLRKALDLWRSQVLADLTDYAFTRPEAALPAAEPGSGRRSHASYRAWRGTSARGHRRGRGLAARGTQPGADRGRDGRGRNRRGR
jgi:DNA-binding winged helix-turn-helix (wHTH) protein